MTDHPLVVTVTHDFICPWCLVGERRLARAIASLPDPSAVRVRYRAYELNPGMPEEGLDRRQYRSAKFGSWEYSQMLDAKTVEAARGDGIAFAYDRIERTPNTRRAHRLMVLAEREGLAERLSDALLSAYFERGRDIGDLDMLRAIAGEVGLDRDEAEDFLVGEAGLEEVLADEAEAARSSVGGVPAIAIGDTVISGAQPWPVIAAALRRALPEPQTATAIG
jgi:predicted DsbA family dithiol-disulfide isomerase